MEGRCLKCPGVLIATTLLATCTTSGGNPTRQTVSGTAWQLIGVQSMDDAQGTMKIADPKQCTPRVEADDRAVLKLDCNRGMG